MSLPCDIAMDLVGLYKDHLASPDSVREIREHLSRCPSCRKYYRLYDSIQYRTRKRGAGAGGSAPFSSDRYTDLSKRLKNRHQQQLTAMLLLAGVAAALTAANLIKMSSDRNPPR